MWRFKMNKQIKASVCLLATAIIWGFAFVAQKDGMSSIGPFLYSALRMLIGSITLCVMFLVNDKIHGDEAVISTPASKVKVVVIPTDEELLIASDTMDILKK